MPRDRVFTGVEAASALGAPVARARPRSRRRMDWIAARREELLLLLTLPHWGALGFGVVFALLWTRLGPPLRFFRPGAFFGIALGAILYPVTVLWVQPEISSAARDALLAIFGQEAVNGRPLAAGAVSALVQAASQEAVQLFGILAVMFVVGFRRDVPTVVTAGVSIALGFSLFEAERFLTPALRSGLTVESALPLVRQLFLIGAHVGAGMMLARSWVDGRFVRYFLVATVLHAALAFAAVLLVSGWPATAALAYFAGIATLGFFWGSGIATARPPLAPKVTTIR